MADFINSVDVKTLVNIYCDGKVQSRTLRYPDGKLQTLGVYLPGEFEFHSEGPEKVIMTAGAVEVLFPEDNDHVQSPLRRDLGIYLRFPVGSRNE